MSETIMVNSNKVLFVDDDDNTLKFYDKILGKQFELTTARTGEEGLEKIHSEGPFAVVVSDMNMPGMDGIHFLSEVTDIAPDVVQIMLTACTDIESAIEVVNEGNIYRFFIKPAPPAKLADSINDAIHQHHLKTLEQKLNYMLRQEIKLREKIENDLRDANSKLELLAREDPLTKLHNRRYLLELFENEFERSKRYGLVTSILMIDIDFFKKINDTYGHLIGDEVLRKMADCIRNNLRKSDISGRFGGEEFLIVLPETTIENAFIAAEKLRKSVSELQFSSGDKTFSITCSIGIAKSAEDISDITTLIGYADQALYVAKDLGRNRVVMPE